MDTEALRYAGFWFRLASLLLDGLVKLPVMALIVWGDSHFRLFKLYYFVPGIIFALFYNVYLVKRFGGTPGKLMVGICIRKLDGKAVGYREAFLRYLPDFILNILMSIAVIVAIFHMSDVEYHSVDFILRINRIIALTPFWYKPLTWIQNAWVWGEFFVLLTNHKKRALHDFIAGTVVIHAARRTAMEPPIIIP